jgi:formamidopyrimidine-DNA glycosylase
MPELPEVETLRRSLAKRLVGRRIVAVEVRERRLRDIVDPSALQAACCCRKVTDLERRGKYLLIHLDGPRSLLVHLGMSGRLRLADAAEPLDQHTHVCFRLDDRRELRFRDHRRFGLVDVVVRSGLDLDPRLRSLGMEPLSRACTAARLKERARGLKRPVKSFLMDARSIAGVGNIYASEALHLAGVHPRRPVGGLGAGSWEALASSLKQVLRDAIRQGGTTFSDFQDADGEAGSFQVFLRVYGREGEACYGCGGRVRRIVLAGRSTFFCPRCQR